MIPLSIAERLINAWDAECAKPGPHFFSQVFNRVLREAAEDPLLVEEIARRNFSRAWPGGSFAGQKRGVQMAWCNNAREAIRNLIEEKI